jgi:RNA polymerase sigma factor (sigma-70 family)
MMKTTAVAPELIARAVQGDLAALDELLASIQGGIYNLAVRMLGNREDAQDASQEILLKVTTHLGSYRSHAAFTTWVYSIARNHLLTAATRTRELPEVSFESLGETLHMGLNIGRDTWGGRAQQPEEKAAAREMAVTCTQGMLMRLDRDHRLAYLLDTVFGLPSEEAAQVLEINAAAYRKRLSRARQSLDEFAQTHCGWVSEQAPCRCDKQVHALGQVPAHVKAKMPPMLPLFHHAQEREQAAQVFDHVVAMSDMAAVLRRHPDWQVPARMRESIRLVLSTHTPEDAAAPAGSAWTRVKQ